MDITISLQGYFARRIMDALNGNCQQPLYELNIYRYLHEADKKYFVNIVGSEWKTFSLSYHTYHVWNHKQWPETGIFTDQGVRNLMKCTRLSFNYFTESNLQLI